MGTAITPEQLKLLGGYAEEVVLALDADRAGREAMLRAQRVAGSGSGCGCWSRAMPAGEDPADMLARGGRRARASRGARRRRSTCRSSTSRALLADADLSTPPGRDRALDEVVPVLAAMGESITRQELMREVADRLDADPELVAGGLRRGRWGRAAAPARAGGPAEGPRRRRRDRRERRPRRSAQAMMLALCIARAEAAARTSSSGSTRPLHLADPGAVSSASASISPIRLPASATPIRCRWSTRWWRLQTASRRARRNEINLSRAWRCSSGGSRRRSQRRPSRRPPAPARRRRPQKIARQGGAPEPRVTHVAGPAGGAVQGRNRQSDRLVSPRGCGAGPSWSRRSLSEHEKGPLNGPFKLPGVDRTHNLSVNSRSLCRLSYPDRARDGGRGVLTLNFQAPPLRAIFSATSARWR